MSSSSPSVDSTTPGDLDTSLTLPTPPGDIKAKFDVLPSSGGDAGYVMLDAVTSGNSTSSKGSDEGVDSDEDMKPASSRMGGVQELEVTGTPPVNGVKLDQDLPDHGAGYGTPAGSPPDLLIPSSTTANPAPLKGGNPGSGGRGPKSGGSQQGAANAELDVNENKENNKVIVIAPNDEDGTMVGGEEKKFLNGVMKQGPQNVTITTPARMGSHCFGGGAPYPQGPPPPQQQQQQQQPHPRNMHPAAMAGMPPGATMTMSANITFGPMSQQNGMSPAQGVAGPPSLPLRHPGYGAPPQPQSGTAPFPQHPGPPAPFNPHMGHQGGAGNGQGFGNVRGPMTQNNGQWFGQMGSGPERRSYAQRQRGMRNPQGMPPYPQNCYSPQGYPNPGQPPSTQGYVNQYNPAQKHVGYGPFHGQTMQNYNSGQMGMGVPGPGPNQMDPSQGNYNGGPAGMGSPGPGPGPGPAGGPMNHMQSGAGPATSTQGGPGFPGFQGNNQLGHFLPTSSPEGPSPANGPVNSSQQQQQQQQHTTNFSNNFGPPNGNQPSTPQQQQQLYGGPMDTVNMNQCTLTSTPPFNTQYNNPLYTDDQLSGNHGSHDNSNSVPSNGNDVTVDIPEFSMFGDYAPQPDYF